MRLQLHTIAEAVGGILEGEDASIEGVSIDSRTLLPGALYIAIKGKNFDGHSFIDQAEAAGAGAVVVERQYVTRLPQIIVKNSRLALAELAGYWRSRLDAKVVGITGSNGKTTVKEMVAAILKTQGHTLFTQGNLNNEIGVPLTLLQLNETHAFAVIEMGANHPGEIGYTSRYAKPDISIITNAGPAHIEGFGDIAVVARSKGEMIGSLPPGGVAVLNRDDTFFGFWHQLAGKRKTVSFGFDPVADITADNIKAALGKNGFETRFTLRASETVPITLRLAGIHNVKNALAAAAAALQFGIQLTDIKSGLEQLKPVVGRLQPLSGRKGGIVIDDTYNANPASLKAALEALNEKDENWVILGAFGELGTDSTAIHREMGELIKSMPVSRLFATGSLAKHTAEAFGQGGRFFDDQEQLISVLTEEITGKETLLVKGSRSQKMENVVAAIVDNFRGG